MFHRTFFKLIYLKMDNSISYPSLFTKHTHIHTKRMGRRKKSKKTKIWEEKKYKKNHTHKQINKQIFPFPEHHPLPPNTLPNTSHTLSRRPPTVCTPPRLQVSDPTRPWQRDGPWSDEPRGPTEAAGRWCCPQCWRRYWSVQRQGSCWTRQCQWRGLEGCLEEKRTC